MVAVGSATAALLGGADAAGSTVGIAAAGSLDSGAGSTSVGPLSASIGAVSITTAGTEVDGEVVRRLGVKSTTTARVGSAG